VNSDLVRLGGAFAAGLVGWLLLADQRIAGDAVWIAALFLGAVAGVIARGLRGFAALVAGVADSYPLAFALGLIAFLGDNWLVYAILGIAVAALGFAGARLFMARLSAAP
jgi:hypothetical protein